MKTTIEINGRIYDARTGKIVNTPSSSIQQPMHKQQPVNHSAPLVRGVVMDGVSRQKTTRAHSASVPIAKSNVLQRSQTLHRKAVKKPGNGKSAPHIHSAATPIQSTTNQDTGFRQAPATSSRVLDIRLGKALAASKSNLISRFGTATAPKPTITHNLNVKEAPGQSPNHQAHSNVSTKTKLGHHTEPIVPINNQQSSKQFVFEDQISKANSHLLKPVKKERRLKRMIKHTRISPKIISTAAAVFAVFTLMGFFAYQNIPAVSMRVAANKAGFDAKLPGSIPSGYAFNGPAYAEDSTVTLTYNSNTDERRFMITQRPTDWSSESLLTNYLLESQFRYQAYKNKGLTVYIYNGANATWVDKGVWFSVNGDEGSLSSEQLLDIASSI